MEDMNEVNEMLGRSYNVGEEVRMLTDTVSVTLFVQYEPLTVQNVPRCCQSFDALLQLEVLLLPSAITATTATATLHVNMHGHC
jgi:hypothetical protein